MLNILDIHQDDIKVLIRLDHIDTFLAVLGVDHNMTIKRQPLREDHAIDVIILGTALVSTRHIGA